MHKVRNIIFRFPEFFHNFSTIFEQEIKSWKSSYETKFKWIKKNKSTNQRRPHHHLQPLAREKTRARSDPPPHVLINITCSILHHFSWNFVQSKARNDIYIMLFESHQIINHRSTTDLMKMEKAHWTENFRCIIHAYLIKSKALKLHKHLMNFKQHDYELKSHNARLEIKIWS